MAGPVTTEELIQKLEHDTEYQARMREKEHRRLKIVAKNRKDSAPVLTDLAKLGFVVETVSDLFNKGICYKKAIPVLMRWLSIMQNRDIKKSLIRTLSVKWAKPQAAPLLIEEYDKLTAPEDSAIRWAIGNALFVVADDSVCDALIRLVEDRSYGADRQMIVMALGNMKDERVVDVLLDVLRDDEVAGHAITALRKQKAKRARPYIEPFLQHERAWVRREAKKALAVFNK